jgi:photosynthetic reaction center H subunit
MPTGAITGYIDVAQLTLYAFWLFFAGLIYYLRREDKREGYPLENERSGLVTVQGFPFLPKPKVFLLSDGHKVYAPRVETPVPVLTGAPVGGWLGAPMDPIGNPMLQGIGPASYVERADVPDMMFDEALPKIVPLRAAPAYWLAEEDPDPRGMAVVGADGIVAGTCSDAWVDRSEMLVRYLEVSLGGVAHSVLVPMTLVRINRDRNLVVVQSVMGDQFADAPVLAHPEQITLREEDRVSAYFAGGQMYASPSRMGPLL